MCWVIGILDRDFEDSGSKILKILRILCVINILPSFNIKLLLVFYRQVLNIRLTVLAQVYGMNILVTPSGDDSISANNPSWNVGDKKNNNF